MKDARKSPLYKKDCACGCPLGFGLTHDGKTVPLDLRAQVYVLTGEQSPGKAVGVVASDLGFVTHFRTCPMAGDFSKE